MYIYLYRFTLGSVVICHAMVATVTGVLFTFLKKGSEGCESIDMLCKTRFCGKTCLECAFAVLQLRDGQFTLELVVFHFMCQQSIYNIFP